MGLRSKISRRYKHKTESADQFPAAPNSLERKFKVLKLNKVWTINITYIWTQQGWFYLCVMLDMFSCCIVDWQSSKHIDCHLVCDAFNYAMARQSYSREVMVHSDQRSQYTRKYFKTLLLTNDAIQSMSRRGKCWDNAVTESFFTHQRNIYFTAVCVKPEMRQLMTCSNTLRFTTIRLDGILQMAGLALKLLNENI